MNVTSKGRYALRIMIDLAQHRDEGYISLKTISDRTQLSMKYLEMIVGNLKKAELVDSTRGKEGGYKLNKTPQEYSIGEILRCIEDNLAPVACIKEGEIQCDRSGACLTVPMWKELDDITNAYLDTVSLEDLLTGDKWRQEKTVD
ncbi:MAG: Rrf2 family transcriptional regulator [Oscillospiraceae bacterium]|nr:Rrf2 family transcriptional regulator [Oscillospiraceae bacterium]